MARIMIWHKLADFDAWKELYDGDVERRNSAGFTEISMTRGSLDPNTLVIEYEGDPAAFEQMLADPELKETMQKGGVEAMDYYKV